MTSFSASFLFLTACCSRLLNFLISLVISVVMTLIIHSVTLSVTKKFSTLIVHFFDVMLLLKLPATTSSLKKKFKKVSGNSLYIFSGKVAVRLSQNSTRGKDMKWKEQLLTTNPHSSPHLQCCTRSNFKPTK